MENKKRKQKRKLYLLLHENNPNRVKGETEKFTAEFISMEEFQSNELEDFATMKKWVLENNKKIAIMEVNNPFISIIISTKN